MADLSVCPECRDGKHPNCTGWAIDEATDEVVECACVASGHLTPDDSSALAALGDPPVEDGDET